MNIFEKTNFQKVESQYLETENSLQQNFREIDRSVPLCHLDEKILLSCEIIF